MENINEKENLVNSIDDKIRKLSSLKCDYWNNDEITQFSIIDLEDKVNELTKIDKFLTFAIDIDNYCQKKLDDIDLLTRA